MPPCLRPVSIGNDFLEPVIIAVVPMYIAFKRLILLWHPRHISKTRNKILRGILSYAAVKSMNEMYIGVDDERSIIFRSMKIALS